jgi:Sulfotransferase family
VADGSARSPGRVLLIGGWGRCGSTLLDMLLGQVPGVVSAGEVRELWLRGCVENRPCGCGAAFADCTFWRQVGEVAFGGWGALELDRTLRARYGIDRPWGLGRLLSRRQADVRNGDLAFYRQVLAQLYDAIRQVSGSSVVVDSSKIPTHALVLLRSEAIDLRLVHLVRDSRGVAYSNTKRVVKQVTAGEPTLLPTHGPVASSARYALYNGLTGELDRLGAEYMLVRYEDLIADPRRRLQEILTHAGVSPGTELPFLAGDGAVLRPSHLVDGNPVRFATGPVQLRADDEWRSRMRPRDRAVVSALTLPFLAAYRYPLRP